MPPAIEPDLPWPDEHELILRILALRKAKKIAPVLAEGGRYWLCEDERDLQGSKVRVTKAQLAALVDLAEKRKEPDREPGENRNAKAVRA